VTGLEHKLGSACKDLKDLNHLVTQEKEREIVAKYTFQINVSFARISVFPLLFFTCNTHILFILRLFNNSYAPFFVASPDGPEKVMADDE